MEISWIQAALLGLFACLSSMPGLGGTSIGNYTLGRPLIGGLVCGIILGDIYTGILGYIFWYNGWNFRNSFILWYCNNQSCLATYGMESC